MRVKSDCIRLRSPTHGREFKIPGRVSNPGVPCGARLRRSLGHRGRLFTDPSLFRAGCFNGLFTLNVLPLTVELMRDRVRAGNQFGLYKGLPFRPILGLYSIGNLTVKGKEGRNKEERTHPGIGRSPVDRPTPPLFHRGLVSRSLADVNLSSAQ